MAVFPISILHVHANIPLCKYLSTWFRIRVRDNVIVIILFLYIIHTLPVSEFLPFLAGTAKRVGKVQCFIFYSTSNLPISFKFLQVFTYYKRKVMCEFH